MNKHTPWSLKETSSGGAILHRPNSLQDYLQIFPVEDAQLIAAAPELLEALNFINMASCYASEENTDMYKDALLLIGNKAREAINKAEGKA